MLFQQPVGQRSASLEALREASREARSAPIQGELRIH